MKYAFINGKILDGTENMQVQCGYDILVDGDKIEDIVPHAEHNGYKDRKSVV